MNPSTDQTPEPETIPNEGLPAACKDEACVTTVLDSLIEGCQIIGRDWICRYINPVAAAQARRPREDFVGKTIRELYSGIEGSMLLHCLNKAINERQPSHFEAEVHRQDGSSSYLQLAVHPVPEGACILSVDLTEQRELQETLLRAGERAQQRIGRELHDGVGQQLTAISLLHSLLQYELVAQKHASTATAGKITALLSDVAQSIRRISHGLQPVADDPDGLVAALERLVTNSLGRKCRFECSQTITVKDARTANHLYLIAQEAVENALLHGKPNTVLIRLSAAKDSLLLEVVDDGCGIKDNAATHGMGFRTMNYRAAAVQGALEVLQPARGGTLIRCSVPIPQNRLNAIHPLPSPTSTMN